MFLFLDQYITGNVALYFSSDLQIFSPLVSEHTHFYA